MSTATKKQTTQEELTPQEHLQQQLDGMSPDERLEFLDLHAHTVKEEEYRAPLSDDELEEVKTRVTRLAIQIQELEDKKQRFMDEFKLEMKPLEAEHEEIVREARTQERVGFGKVWTMPDTESKTTFKVAEGNVITSSRPSYKEELAPKLFVG